MLRSNKKDRKGVDSIEKDMFNLSMSFCVYGVRQIIILKLAVDFFSIIERLTLHWRGDIL